MKKMIIDSSAQQVIVRRIGAVAIAILLFPGVTLVAQARDGAQTSTDRSSKNGAASEQLITREPRQDAPNDTDPAFPVIHDCCDDLPDLSEICECTRLINQEIRRIRQEPGWESAQVDKSADLVEGADENSRNNLKTSIVGYLKTILAELRSDADQASCSESHGQCCKEDSVNSDSSSN